MKKEAVKAAEKAMKIGMEAAEESGNEFGYAEMINNNIAEWSAK